MSIPHALTGEWQFVARLKVEGREMPGLWDSVDGGDTTSDTRSYRPGGNVRTEALPAAMATGDVILERAYRATLDGPDRIWMADRIGFPASVTIHAMDTRGDAVPGTLETIDGILKEVTRPGFRSEGDGPALYRVVVTPHGNWKTRPS
jgi:hypothetical protein